MPLQSYQSKRRKLNSSTPLSSSSPSAKLAAAPATPSKPQSASSSSARASTTSTKAKPKAPASSTPASKKRRASVVYVDVSDNDEDANLPVYTVQDIVNHRKAADGHYQYYIKWEGYSHDQNTWEYDRNVLDKSLIEAYWDSYADNRIRKAEEKLAAVKRQLEEKKARRRDDAMDVGQSELGRSQSPATAKSLLRAVRSKQHAPSPVRRIPSMVPNASPDRRPAKLCRLVTRRERDVRGSSVDSSAKDTDADVDIERGDDSDLDDDDGILLGAVRSSSHTLSSPSHLRRNPPATIHRHGAAASPKSPSAAPAFSSTKAAPQTLPGNLAQRIADMDQAEIFAFLESRVAPKPEAHFSPQVMQVLTKLSEHELVDLLATRGIHLPDDASYVRPSPSQHARLNANKDASSFAPIPTNAESSEGDESDGDSHQVGGKDGDDDGDDDDNIDNGDDSDLDTDDTDPSKPHPLAHMYRGLAKLLVPVPEEEILQWIYDRKYADSIDCVLGFDDTSPETQTALAEAGDLASAANPLVYVLYKDGSESRVSLGNLICRAPKVAADFLLNMRVQILEDEMTQLAASQGPGSIGVASQRVPFVQGMFGSQLFSQRRALSLRVVEEGESASNDEAGDGETAGGESDESREGLLPADVSDIDLASQVSVAAMTVRFTREPSQQPMDSPSKVDAAASAQQSSTRASPKLHAVVSSTGSDEGGEPDQALTQTLARSSMSPISKSPLPGQVPLQREPTSPTTPTFIQEPSVTPRVGGLLTTIVQSFTPKRWSMGQEKS